MAIAERVAARSTAAARRRAEAEIHRLLEAALVLLSAGGTAGLTVAGVLAEAQLSTRAFYRHFASKDELVLAVFAAELERSQARSKSAMGRAESNRGALIAWIDETLALGFRPARAARTRTLLAEGARLRSEHPDRFAETFDAILEPLVTTLRAGRESGEFPSASPEADAISIHAVTWELVARRLDGDQSTSITQARTHALRFCLPALGTT